MHWLRFVLQAGNEEQKNIWCNCLNEGGMAAFALTEPGPVLMQVPYLVKQKKWMMDILLVEINLLLPMDL